MTTIVTRAGKGSALTWTEGDSNFTNLNTAKLENVVEDTTPQLGGNLDVNGNSIVSTSNGNIVIEPNGTGDVHIITDAVRIGDLNAEARISSYGTGNLVLTTNEGNDPDPTITIGNGANANITLAPSGTGTVIISGNLQVDGTTTTVNSTTVTVDDPIFTLGGNTAPASDDNKDRGIEFRWHNGTTAKVGFFGYDDSTGYLTFIPDATNTSEVFSGTLGDIQATNFRGALIGNADTATTATNATNININTTTGNASDTTLYPVLVGAASTGNQLPHIDSGVLTFNASTNILSSTGFAGALNGTVGATTASSGAFTTLTASGAVTLSPSSAAVAISPTGTGTVAISPAGALTINPTTASTINNTSIGATTASTGRFTTVTSTIATGTAPFTVASTTKVANLNVEQVDGYHADEANTVSTIAVRSASGIITSTGFAGALNGTVGATTKAAGTFTTMTADTAVLDDIRETVFALTYGATITPDAANGSVQTVTLTGNVTFSAFSNPVSGQTITLIITQDATGSRTLTSTMKFAGGSKTLSTAANSIDILTVSYIGTTYYASLSKGFA